MLVRNVRIHAAAFRQRLNHVAQAKIHGAAGDKLASVQDMKPDGAVAKIDKRIILFGAVRRAGDIRREKPGICRLLGDGGFQTEARALEHGAVVLNRLLERGTGKQAHLRHASSLVLNQLVYGVVKVIQALFLRQIVLKLKRQVIAQLRVRHGGQLHVAGKHQ